VRIEEATTRISMVIDTNVYLTYITYSKLYRLVNAITLFDLKVYISENIIEEIARNAKKIGKENIDDIIDSLIPSILAVTIKVDPVPSFSLSPDKKDNFLFDLAIQSNSSVIVTQEKVLLQFSTSPIPIKDIKWFKETYPVPL